MRILVHVFLLMALFTSVPCVRAVVCSNDVVPAATLLFPFVVYDYSGNTSANTVFSVTNIGKDSQIVHVTIWSDVGAAILNFNIVLSGYDVQAIDMREILRDGNLPVTGTSGDLLVSPNAPPQQLGPVESVDILPLGTGTDTLSARCDPSSQYYPGDSAGLTQVEIDWVEMLLTASQAVTRVHDDCWGNTYLIEDWFQHHDLSMATWFYVTASVVETCDGVLPSDPAYWNGHARYDNVLMGDVMWVDDVANSMEFDTAVHLEADLNLAAVADTDVAGRPASFDYFHSTGAGAPSDFREPLPTAWAMRYAGAQTTGWDTYLRVWKGPSTLQDLVPSFGQVNAMDCLAYSYYAWDEDENVIVGAAVGYQPNLFPLRTQEVLVDELNLPFSSSGWLLFQWPRSNMAYDDADFYQTWMGVKAEAFARFSGATEALALQNSNCTPGTAFQLLFRNGFESGDTSGWSTSVP